MNVNIEEISSIRKKIDIEIPAEKVAEEIEKAYVKVGKTAKLKGFRPGKVPRGVLEKTYGDQVKFDVVQSLINENYFKAIMDNGLNVISQPDIKDAGELDAAKPFTFSAEVEVKPEVTVEHVKGLAFDKEAYTFDEGRVETHLEQMAQGKATLEPVDREVAEQGDTVIIDFKGLLDGEAFENGSASDYQLELGSNAFIPGFEEAIVGMKKGEEKAIDLSFPENYGAEDLAGKDVTFETVLKEIKVKVLPELDDDFAKELGKESLDALKSEIRKGFLAEDEGRIKAEFEDRVRAALVEANPVEVPQVMVNGQLDAMYKNFEGNVKAQGLNMEMLGLNRERFDETYLEAATTRVKSGLLLEGIGKAEEIKVEQEDFDAKLKDLAETTNTDLKVVENHFKDANARRMLYSEIFDDKVLRFVVENGTVNELSADELAAKNAPKDDEEGDK